jgi:hypothetical protein
LVLGHLSLMQLRLVKTVSRSMANRCRKVLRSKEWQGWSANEHAMACEVATQATRSYALPLKVMFFEDDLFHDDDICFGTIHRLKLKLVRRTDSVRSLDSLLGANWALYHLIESGDFDVEVADMLIEVDGRGLCGSEYALRRVLADALEQRTLLRDTSQTTKERARDVCDTTIWQEVNDDGTPDWGEVDQDAGRQWRFWKLLEEINPVTDVGGPHGYMVHRVTHQQQYGRDVCDVDLLHLCSNHPGVIT